MQSIGYDPAYGPKNRNHQLYIEPERHTFVGGSTGTGKSTLFVNLIQEHIRLGHGVVVVDPHGPLAEGLLDSIPKERTNDVVYFDGIDYNLDLNPFDIKDPKRREFIIESTKQLIYEIWKVEGAEMDNIITYTLNAVFDAMPIPTLPVCAKFLNNPVFRRTIVKDLREGDTRSFFVDTYDNWHSNPDGWDKRMRVEKSASSKNKFNRFISSRLLNRVFREKKSFDFREAIDTKKILIFNLSKARLGSRNTSFIGNVVMHKYQEALLSRQDVVSHLTELAASGKMSPKELDDERDNLMPPSYAFVDEFQTVMSDVSIAFAEARKYRCALAVATQIYTLLSEEVQKLIVGNCGNLILYRVSSGDAKIFAQEFGNEFGESAIRDQSDFHFKARVVTNHTVQKVQGYHAFKPAKTSNRTASREKVLRSVRENHIVSSAGAKWANTTASRKPEKRSVSA